MTGCASGPRTAGLPDAFQELRVFPIRTIVVDAGHGGHDPGTMHHGLREKDLALDIAHRLDELLRARGFSVVMTRDRDEFVELNNRPAIANRLRADLFISVHLNANRRSHVSGLEVYYPRESLVSVGDTFPIGVEPEEVAQPSPTIRQILWDVALLQAREQSQQIAMHICEQMAVRVEAPCRTVRPARFVVLRQAHMPAVLVEAGYVSNQTDAARLEDDAYRQALAEGIVEGLLSYLRTLEVEHL